MPFLTIFTPAYNRAHTIHRTYNSLLKQDCKDFVWLIVDDGSTDNTAELVRGWQKNDNGFEIRYIYKENGGMHTAHNTAYENIDTELNVCIDSDDCLAENAVKKIIDKWNQVKNQGFAGIIGLDADFDGNIIGKGFPSDLQETTLMGYYANGGSGDKKLVYRTDIIKKYPPYPEFPNEKYVGLNYKYILCDQEYKLYPLNEILCNVEYQADGSSNNMYRQYFNNPQGWIFYRKFCMQYKKGLKNKFKECVHYVSSCFIAKEKHIIKNSNLKILTVFAFPLGFLFSFFVKYKNK